MIKKVEGLVLTYIFILKILKCVGNTNVDVSFVMLFFNFNDMHQSFKHF